MDTHQTKHTAKTSAIPSVTSYTRAILPSSSSSGFSACQPTHNKYKYTTSAQSVTSDLDTNETTMTFILGFCKTDGDLAAQQKPRKLPLPLPLALLGLDQVHHLKTPTRDQVKQVPKVIVSELSLLVRYLKIDADEKTVPNKEIFFLRF